MNNRLLKSQQRKYEESAKKISSIIQREKDRFEWRRQKYAMEKHMGRSAKTVQASTEDSGIFDFTGQDQVENAIWDIIHKKMFYLAEQATICQGQLRGDFIYPDNTPATSKVLSGTYNYPSGCDP